MISSMGIDRGHAETQHLIPWWLTGRLGDDEARLVESHLAQCAECRADLEIERRVRDAVRQRTPVESAPQMSYQKLWRRIAGAEQGAAATSGSRRAERVPARMLEAGQRWSLAAGLLLGLGVGLLTAASWRSQAPGEPAQYHVATSSQASAASQVTQIRVVFSAGVTLEEVSEIVRGNGLAIVDGPSEAGVFGLAVTPNDDASVLHALERLRADLRIRFAEPARPVAPTREP